jgi:hypothetical protein
MVMEPPKTRAPIDLEKLIDLAVERSRDLQRRIDSRGLRLAMSTEINLLLEARVQCHLKAADAVKNQRRLELERLCSVIERRVAPV